MPEQETPVTFEKDVDLTKYDVCQGHGQYGQFSIASTVCALAQEGENTCESIDRENCGWWEYVEHTGTYYGKLSGVELDG